MLTVSSALLAFACVWVLLPRAEPQLARAGMREDSPVVPTRALGIVGVGGATALVVAAPVLAFGELSTVLVGALIVMLAVRRLLRRWRDRRARHRRQRDTIALCDALAAELRAGLPAAVAVRRSCGDFPEWASVARAAELGGDVPAALRRCSAAQGAEGLAAIAAAWQVAVSSGAALAVVLERIAMGLRADEDARAEVVAALGAPRATAKVLAGLPVFGLALGISMGARPARFLLSSAFGLACLLAGITLAVVGVWWVERLADNAEG